RLLRARGAPDRPGAGPAPPPAEVLGWPRPGRVRVPVGGPSRWMRGDDAMIRLHALPSSRTRRPARPRPSGRSRRRCRARVFRLEDRTLLSTFLVDNTEDSGPGSLRQAILDADAATGRGNTIAFRIPGPGVQTIAPTSPLPAIRRGVL